MTDPEAEALALYARLNLDPHEPPGVGRVAVALLGARCIERVDARVLRGADAETCMVHGTWRIFVRRGLATDRLAHVVGHELGHIVLGATGETGDELERLCDAIGAAIVAPRPAFRAAIRDEDGDVHRLAERYRITPSCSTMRIGECTGEPVALVTPGLVRVRGPEEFVWGDEGTLRRLARTGAPGLRRVQLVEGRGRTALFAG